MKKLRLDIDALDVVSFPTASEPETPRGTVRGNSAFTLGWHDSCYGMCRTNEYDTCLEAGPTVGTSCDYFCTAPTIGCTPPPETEYCG